MMPPIYDQMVRVTLSGEVGPCRCDDMGEVIAYLEDVARDMRLGYKLDANADMRRAAQHAKLAVKAISKI